MPRTEPARYSPNAVALLGRLGTAVADLLFPPHCVVCHRYGAWFCSPCMAKIRQISPPLCDRCGMPLAAWGSSRHAPALATGAATRGRQGGTRGICRWCRSAPSQLDAVRAYAYHTDPLRKAIHEFKYRGVRNLATAFGTLMAQGWVALAPDGGEPDVIVPVPLHSARQRQRGFNQAALLSRELGIHLHRPVVEGVLTRIRPTRSQVGLAEEERKSNVAGAFHCVGDSLTGSCVLLVDDVFTTGSTLEEAASALHGAGVKSVWAFTLAHAGDHAGQRPHIDDKEVGRWN